MTTNPNTPSKELSDDDLTAVLQASGMIETRGPSEYHRIKVQAATFYADDDLLGVTNHKTGAPGFVAQLVNVPKEYQAKWFDAKLAAAVGRDGTIDGVPSIIDRMCKSHYDVEAENRLFAHDGTSCEECPVNPFIKREELIAAADGQKCQWRGDLQLRVLQPAETEAGWEFAREAQTYYLSLSITGMIEFKGTGRDPAKGSVSDANFMHKLARLGASMTPEEPGKGVMQAIAALRTGLVIAEVRSLPTSSQDGSRHYHVTSLTPIKILDALDAPALPGPESADGSEVDDIPF